MGRIPSIDRRMNSRIGLSSCGSRASTCEWLEERAMLSGETALDTYVAAPDASFSFSQQSTVFGLESTGYVLDMTSQTWRTPAEVNQTEWQHWVTVIVPDNVANSTGILFIDGGRNPGSPPNSVALELELLAIATQSVVIHLSTVPNQPLVFSDETFSRSEDALLAYTFDKFLTTGDDTWPALLPMVKSAVRAMDAAEQFLPTVTGGALTLDNFVVAGASKRGWTTWLTAAVDPRVTAVVPVVIDVLNMDEQIAHHLEYYEGVTQNIVGGYSGALGDYVALNVFDRLETPEGQALLEIIDPYSYLDRLDMPKYLLNATGDEFFVPDSAQFYFDDLLGTNYVRYVPNSGHGITNTTTNNIIDAISGVVPFYNTVVSGGSLPEFSWTLEDGGQTIRVQSVDTPRTVTMWQATNPVNRDFRWYGGSGPQWSSTALVDQGGGVYVANMSPPASGATAFMVELRFDSPGVFDYVFTTQISVLDPSAAPVANAGGTYVGVEGSPIALTGGGSGTITLYEWDLDNDGTYETPGQVVNFDPGDDGVFTVGLRVTGPDGSDTDTATVIVNNVAPTAAISGTTDIYRGETVTYTLTATDPSPVDQAGLFNFEIDWDGNGTVDETVAHVLSGSTVQRTFPTVAANNIQVRATDKDAATGNFAQTPITVSPHVLRDDGGGNIDLIYGGTPGLDAVFVFGSGSALSLFVQFENLVQVDRLNVIGSGVTGKIIMYGYDSTDVLVAQLANGNVVEIRGGEGDDVVVGGFLGDALFGDAGNDLILGGTQATDGDDQLFGGAGRDTLFGNIGADTLDGGAGEDLLVSDRLNFTGSIAPAVIAISDEWKSARPFAERVTNILGTTFTGSNGSTILDPGVNILDDVAQDTLIGGLGDLDWFFYDFDQDLLGDAIEIDEEETDSDP